MNSHRAEIAVVGAGIVGLAITYAHAKRGRKVALFERTEKAVGASIRNFGLLWPIGQPLGPLHERALRSREIWLEAASKAGLWHAPTGSLHLAYHRDELEVIEEFYESARPRGLGRALLTPDETLSKSSAVRADGLLGSLWSPTEVMVDPREAIRKIPQWLEREFNVTLRLGCAVNQISMPVVETKDERWTLDQAYVCSGADFETLYPQLFAASGMTKCKLQMMRTAPQPQGWQLGPSLCAGLTLTHYEAFKCCQSLASLKERFRREMPFCVENGIHVLVSQTALGELTIGDSHHYGLTPEPFDREEINQAILRYLKTFAVAPSFDVAERWHGVYPKLEGKTEFVVEPEKGVTIVNGLGGAGMTLSFGLADSMVEGTFKSSPLPSLP